MQVDVATVPHVAFVADNAGTLIQAPFPEKIDVLSGAHFIGVHAGQGSLQAPVAVHFVVLAPTGRKQALQVMPYLAPIPFAICGATIAMLPPETVPTGCEAAVRGHTTVTHSILFSQFEPEHQALFASSEHVNENVLVPGATPFTVSM